MASTKLEIISHYLADHPSMEVSNYKGITLIHVNILLPSVCNTCGLKKPVKRFTMSASPPPPLPSPNKAMETV
jgi:hypothetical protein